MTLSETRLSPNDRWSSRSSAQRVRFMVVRLEIFPAALLVMSRAQSPPSSLMMFRRCSSCLAVSSVAWETIGPDW